MPDPTVTVALALRLHPEIAEAVDAAAAAAGVDPDRFVSDALLAYAGSPATDLRTGLASGRVRTFLVPVEARDALMSLEGSPGSIAAAREAVRRAVVATLVGAAAREGSLAVNEGPLAVSEGPLAA